MANYEVGRTSRTIFSHNLFTLISVVTEHNLFLFPRPDSYVCLRTVPGGHLPGLRPDTRATKPARKEPNELRPLSDRGLHHHVCGSNQDERDCLKVVLCLYRIPDLHGICQWIFLAKRALFRHLVDLPRGPRSYGQRFPAPEIHHVLLVRMGLPTPHTYLGHPGRSLELGSGLLETRSWIVHLLHLRLVTKD